MLATFWESKGGYLFVSVKVVYLLASIKIPKISTKSVKYVAKKVK